MKRFKLLKDSLLNEDAKEGCSVYEYIGCDYGLARDDTELTGIKHISVTLDPDGIGTPFFTVPFNFLEEQH